MNESDNDHVYEIQKVTDVRRAASLKAGGAGMRYTVLWMAGRAICIMKIITCGLWRSDKFSNWIYQ